MKSACSPRFPVQTNMAELSWLETPQPAMCLEDGYSISGSSQADVTSGLARFTCTQQTTVQIEPPLPRRRRLPSHPHCLPLYTAYRSTGCFWTQTSSGCYCSIMSTWLVHGIVSMVSMSRVSYIYQYMSHV